MDLSMPGIDGIEGTARLRDSGEEARVVVLTSFVEHERVTAALAAGAVGYLLKDSDPRDVLEAIRSAAAGYAPLDARVTVSYTHLDVYKRQEAHRYGDRSNGGSRARSPGIARQRIVRPVVAHRSPGLSATRQQLVEHSSGDR